MVVRTLRACKNLALNDRLCNSVIPLQPPAIVCIVSYMYSPKSVWTGLGYCRGIIEGMVRTLRVCKNTALIVNPRSSIKLLQSPAIERIVSYMNSSESV